MSVGFEVEEFRDHYYLVRGEVDGDAVETRFLADPAALDALGVGSSPAANVVRATVAFLLQRQRLDELPPQADLEDVAAAYPDFEDALRAALDA